MAGKLYWRIKKDGKWTWVPARVHTVKELPSISSTRYTIRDLEVNTNEDN